jgi:hypothetical protein
MPVFDKKVMKLIRDIDSTTDEILEKLNNDDSSVDQIGELYKVRKKMIANMDDYIAIEENRQLLAQNDKEWISLMEPIKQKDEKALELLEKRVKEMEKELKSKESQKQVLKYEENKL